MILRKRSYALLVCLLPACTPTTNAPAATTPPDSPPTAQPEANKATTAPAAEGPEEAPGAAGTTATNAGTFVEGQACGALDCRLFSSPEKAFAHVLEAEKPLVIGIGEAHALKGTENVPSTTHRFTHQLLPTLERRANVLIVELLNPDPRCKKQVETVEREQKQVTKEQAQSNKNEYVELGHRSKALGIEPFLLSPTCPEYQAIVDADDDSIVKMLETIAKVTDRMAKGALVKNKKANAERLVIAYGGGLHNDIAPRQGRELWSYGPSLSQFTNGRYVEVDLIVREYIKDTDVWQGLPWYPHFDKAAHPDKTVLLRPAPDSYVLFFPKGEA